MSRSTVHTRPEALQLVATALTRYGHDVPQVTASAEMSFRQLIAQLTQIRAERANDLARAEEALRNSNEESRAACQAAVQRAQEALRAADQALVLAQEAADRHTAAARRLRAECERAVARGVSELRAMGVAVERYGAGVQASGALGSVALAGSGGGAPMGSGGSLAAALAAMGMQLVDVASVDYRDNPVISYPHGAGPADYRWAVEKWDSVVGPGVAAGMTHEDFDRLDRENGATGLRRLAGVYDMMLGGEAMLLDQNPDGSIGVTSGRHRLDAARELGITSLPAKVR